LVVSNSGGEPPFPPEKLDALLAGLRAACDAASGTFTITYATVAITACRRR
jgi:hypothetical protein